MGLVCPQHQLNLVGLHLHSWFWKDATDCHISVLFEFHLLFLSRRSVDIILKYENSIKVNLLVYGCVCICLFSRQETLVCLDNREVEESEALLEKWVEKAVKAPRE